MEDEEASSLAAVVERMTGAGEGDPIRVDEIVAAVGQRSFGPMLLIPGLIVLSPISGIPGIPTLGAVAVILIAGQMLAGRSCFWLPQFLLRRQIRRSRMAKAGRFLMPVARFVDRFVKPRLTFLTHGPAARAIAGVCVAIGLSMPPLEAILFANVATAAAISAFGLAVLADDGLLAILAFVLTVGGLGFGLYMLLA